MRELLQIYLNFAADTGILLVIFLFGLLVYGSFKGSKSKDKQRSNDIKPD